MKAKQVWVNGCCGHHKQPLEGEVEFDSTWNNLKELSTRGLVCNSLVRDIDAWYNQHYRSHMTNDDFYNGEADIINRCRDSWYWEIVFTKLPNFGD